MNTDKMIAHLMASGLTLSISGVRGRCLISLTSADAPDGVFVFGPTLATALDLALRAAADQGWIEAKPFWGAPANFGGRGVVNDASTIGGDA